MSPKVVVITGPTATGKTKLGVELAKAVNGEIVSADSMQIYKYMDIGTAKPTPAEMENIPHHMIGTVSPLENYSVSRYVEDASACVNDILSKGKIPIIVGGTGLYIESLLSGRTFAPETSDKKLRNSISEFYDEHGGDVCLERLAAFDPESAGRLHANDKKRIVRALEIYELTGKTISEHNAETQLLPPKYEACKIALSFSDRQDLYDRINRRVDIMIASGLEKEVRDLLASGLTPAHTSMQAIGYKEMLDAVSGTSSMAEAIENIKMESRRYSKRQLSWLRRDKTINWILWEKEPDFGKGLLISTGFLEKYGIL